ncbi:hypothetical protein JL722_13313 [Aureococcus anophagefferens]|nr:hypothetical protein JL722_13313 [Aureococcus anophagefferens]
MPRAVTSGYRARDSDANIQAAARPSPPSPVCAPPPAARPAQDWIEALTGTVVDPDRLGDELRNGVVLCELACAISPGIVKRISDSPLPYKQMDNIAAFSAACKKLGVPEHDCFDTIDLFEGKDIVAVVQTIHALGRTVQLSREDLPKLGPRLATRTGASSRLCAGGSSTRRQYAR